MLNDDSLVEDDPEEVKGREDFTGERTPTQRRLDSYAKLLAAHSMCVAVSIIDNKVYISANEFFQGTQSAEKNQNICSVEIIDQYFSTIVRAGKDVNQPTEKERKDAFVEVCSVARFSTQYKASFSKTISNKIANQIYQRHDPKISDICREHGKRAPMASMMYAKFQSLLEDFSKVEEELRGTTDDQELRLAFLKEHIILKTAKESGMHAEMQQLAQVIRLIEQSTEAGKELQQQDIYFGISKLCCLHCHATLKAANEIFKEKEIPITLIVRGWHDLNKGGPLSDDVFTEKSTGRTRSEKKEGSNIGFLIKKRSDEIFKVMMIQEKQRKQQDKEGKEDKDDSQVEGSDDYVDMEHSESGSESQEAIARQIAMLQNKLKDEKHFLMTQKEVGCGLENIIRKLDVAISLLSIKQFTDVHREELSSEELSSTCIAILELLNVNKEDTERVTNEELWNIIQDPSLVGVMFSQPFKSYSKQQTQELEQEEFHTGEIIPSVTFSGDIGAQYREHDVSQKPTTSRQRSPEPYDQGMLAKKPRPGID